MLEHRSIVRDQIGGQSVVQLAETFGTPVYVYDARVLRRQIDRLRDFDVIRYAQKANSNLSILREMRTAGVLLDAVSAGELSRAEAAGYDMRGDPPPVVFTADLFDEESLRWVVDHGVHCNLGSPDMIRQLGEARAARRSNLDSSGSITLRINPGFGHGHSQKTNTGGPQSKHGIWHTQLADCVRQATEVGLTVTGLHMHIGSGTDFEHLAQVSDSMRAAARIVGSQLRSISAGGGLPTVYRESDEDLDVDRYFENWHATRVELANELEQELRLEIEPGRFLVADCGFLICRICAVKNMGENLFYLVDAGFNNLARPILYGAYHPMSICHANSASDPPDGPDSTAHVVVGGPLCESGDIFTQKEGGVVDPRILPRASVGDYLIIECTGAYGFVMSSNYNSKPLAGEVLIDSGRPRIIRRRQSLPRLFDDELNLD